MREHGQVALLEVCFISNSADMQAYDRNKDRLAQAIAGILLRRDALIWTCKKPAPKYDVGNDTTTATIDNRQIDVPSTAIIESSTIATQMRAQVEYLQAKHLADVQTVNKRWQNFISALSFRWNKASFN